MFLKKVLKKNGRKNKKRKKYRKENLKIEKLFSNIQKIGWKKMRYAGMDDMKEMDENKGWKNL